jgi:glycerophosphoryl diester phosphodiesterase
MATANLYVTGDGTSLKGWNNEGGPPYYPFVDDKPDHDGASTALYSPTAGDEVTFTHEAMPANVASIVSVTVHNVVKKLDPVDALTRAVVRVGGTSYRSGNLNPTDNTTWQDLQNTWSTNPATGAAWTVAEVNAAEFGIYKENAAGERVTQVYATVVYTASAAQPTPATIRGYLGTSNLGNAVAPVNVPTDGTAPVAGDWMIVTVNTVNSAATVTAPTGWTTLLATIAMGSRNLAIFAKRRVAGETNYSFTLSASAATQTAITYGPGGDDISTWKLGAFSKAASSTLTQTTTAVANAVVGSLAVSLQGEATVATEVDSDITVATPFTKLFWTIATSGTPVNSILTAYRAITAAGSTGDAVSTWKNSTGNRGSMMVVIPPKPAETGTPTPVARLAAKMADGAGNVIDVGLVGWDGAGEVALSKIEFVHAGTSVPELDATDRVWTMGHRGGSIDYQEHCTHGYLNCAINHLDVLEFSVAKTIDGVYVGAHDETADRTSSSVKGQNWKFSEHTWAEVQALVQDLPNRGDTRYTTAKYMRIEEFIDTWASSHTLMFDPKVINTAGRVGLYDIIKTIPDYKNRVLGKYYTTGTAIADEFHAIGVKVWGYSYTADLTTVVTNGDGSKTYTLRTDRGSTAADAGKWDYLGLEYNADPAVWALMMQVAGTKKVIAHICPTVAAARQGVAGGAKALQVSGVRAVSSAF